jgi:hypothetical protein
VEERSNQDIEIFGDGQSDSVLAAFTDLRFRKVTAHRAAPALFVLVLLGAALLYFVVAVTAFKTSVVVGLFWLILAGPAVCFAGILVMRVAIELLLSVMVMMEQLEDTSEVVLEIAELTTGISAKTEVIPTLPSFVRGVRSRRRMAIADMRERVAAREAAGDGTADQS